MARSEEGTRDRDRDRIGPPPGLTAPGPGTGKSQTITNLLANALSRGMKVLFVAEKPDARAVVRERLQAVGLDPFCLDLHDQGSGPQAIKDQLRDALDYRPKDVEAKWETLEERYHTVVGILSGYRDRVHGATATGRSYFDSFEALLEMGTEPSAPIGRGLVDVPEDDIAAIRRMLLELPSYAEAAQVQVGHPWSLAGTIDVEAVDRDQLVDLIRTVEGSLTAVVQAPETWQDALGQTTSGGAFYLEPATPCRERALGRGHRGIRHGTWRVRLERLGGVGVVAGLDLVT